MSLQFSPQLLICDVRAPSRLKQKQIMSDSDSENSNLSELEEEDAVSVDGNDSEDDDKKELKGTLDDIEETGVNWSDLVKLF